MIRKALKVIFRILFRLFTTVEISGLENVPQKQGFILAPNHLGVMDAPLMFAMIPREDVSALVAKKHQKNLLFSLVVNIVGGIWLNRDEADTQALRAAIKFLQNGGVLGISPEGTRSKSGTLLPGKTGIAYVADKANAPVLPAAITGTHQGIKRLLTFHRPHITIRFGELLTFQPLERKNRDRQMKENTDFIMCQIAAMLPPEYRGAYSNGVCREERLELEKEESLIP